jgi:outer membrane protein
MKGKKLVMTVGIILCLGGWLGPVWAAELKVACVDIQKAVNECIAGKEAKKAIAKEMEKYQQLFLEKQKGLQTMKESLDKQGAMLNPEARATKEKEFQAKLRESQRWAEDSQNEIKQKGMEMDRNITNGLLKIIQRIGLEDGYSLILANENIVIFASKTIDITDRVIKLFDAQKK